MREKTPLVIVIANRIQATREMLLGITDFAQTCGPWNIHPLEVGDWRKASWKWEKWQADGLILAEDIDFPVAQRIRDAGLPTVLLQVTKTMSSPAFPLADAPRCDFDSKACGRLAAQTLVRLGHRDFAIVEHTDTTIYWSVDRMSAFRDELSKLHPAARCFSYGQPPKACQRNWLLERPHLIAWLQSLPTPCALFVANDRRAIQVSEACRLAGLSVPDKISILSVDDDHWLCNASTPTLSSIRFNTHAAGFKIAEILADMMNGNPHAGDRVTVAPVEVVTRQSTDWFAVADEKVALALQHIHNDYADPSFSIPRLARLTGLARRTLEIRFRNATGKTIHDEIDFVRLAHIDARKRQGTQSRKELLAHSGFRSLSAMDRAMKKSRESTTSSEGLTALRRDRRRGDASSSRS